MFLFFNIAEEFGGKIVSIVKKIEVKPNDKKTITIYEVSQGQTLICPQYVLYSESEVTNAKLLVDNSIYSIYEPVWGNPIAQSAKIFAKSTISLEINNNTMQHDILWIKILGVEIPTALVKDFIQKLKESQIRLC